MDAFLAQAGQELAGEVAAGLERVAAVFDAQLRTDLPAVAGLVRHVERYRGKMLRPALVLIGGLATLPGGKKLGYEHDAIAAVCEMVHMATLVHDDVLDEAEVRRRGLTVNRLHGNEAAVILGDYLIAAAYHLCATLATREAAAVVGHASMVMCAGELLQLHHREDFSLDEATYFEIVGRKTGALIAAACRLGAVAAGASEAQAAALHAYGMDLGVAFQIQDDLLDLTGEERVVGKSVGKDLEKGKLTLPMIHHLASAGVRTRGESLRLLEAAAGGTGRGGSATTGETTWGGAAGRLREALEATGSVAQARAHAERLVARAKAALTPLDEGHAKQALIAMADAVVTRAY